jgi:hypothetical protein
MNTLNTHRKSNMGLPEYNNKAANKSSGTEGCIMSAVKFDEMLTL